MSDIATKNLEKTVKTLLDRWAGKIKKPLQDIRKIDEELTKLEAKKELTPAEQKLRDRCIQARKALVKKVDKATSELKLELRLVTPPPEMSKSEFEKVKKKIQGMLKTIEKGLQVTDTIRLKPDMDFDLKKRKFKKFGVILEWRF
jgi:hypothetical protein